MLTDFIVSTKNLFLRFVLFVSLVTACLLNAETLTIEHIDAPQTKVSLHDYRTPEVLQDTTRSAKNKYGSSSTKAGNSKGKATSSSSNIKHENTTGGQYWITGSTGKTHRKGCRWYGNTQYGYYSDNGSGDNCKKCGGAGK